jgi:hypothetical protein
MGKHRHAAVAEFDLDADREVFRLSRELHAGDYRVSPWRLRMVHDPERRLIAAPAVRDRVVHRALLDALGPHYERRYIDHSYTGGPGRGPHRAALQFLAWQRRFGHRMHLDIHRYFPSIPHRRLEALLFATLTDPDTRELIHRLLAAGDRVYRHTLARTVLGPETPPRGQGLPLGSFLSQWCGTFYLDGLDHFVKRTLKIPGYLRSMDDCVLFAQDRAQLTEARTAITQWLARERALSLNPSTGTVLPTRAPTVFLGYHVTRSGISPSRRLRRRLKHRLAVAATKGEAAFYRTVASYRGLLLFPY